jgi:hypothetical protein
MMKAYDQMEWSFFFGEYDVETRFLTGVGNHDYEVRDDSQIFR